MRAHAAASGAPITTHGIQMWWTNAPRSAEGAR